MIFKTQVKHTKSLAIAVFVALIALVSCKNNKEFTINGKIENRPDSAKIVRLYKVGTQDEIPLIDSAFLSKDGKFKFKSTTPHAEFYGLSIGNKSFIFIANNGDALTLKANYTDTTGTYQVAGSEESEKIMNFKKIRASHYKKFSAEYAKFGTLLEESDSAAIRNDTRLMDSLNNSLNIIYNTVQVPLNNLILTFAKTNNNFLAGFYATTFIDPNVENEKNEKGLSEYAKSIQNKFPNNKLIQEFITKTIQAESLAIGSKPPDFELLTPEGKPVKLSDFKGKYVLVDFWAAWCMPCRVENTNVVKAYQTFKDKNFTILGVSLDTDKIKWTKAIKTDKLAWTQVSDLKG